MSVTIYDYCPIIRPSQLRIRTEIHCVNFNLLQSKSILLSSANEPLGNLHSRLIQFPDDEKLP